MGPSGRTVFFVLAALAGGAWLVVRAPSRLSATTLPRLAADGTPSGQAPAGTCAGAKGCLIVYVAPWCGPCKQSLPGDRALADLVKDRGIETTFVVGMDAMPKCAEMARAIGREVLVDASGAWVQSPLSKTITDKLRLEVNALTGAKDGDVLLFQFGKKEAGRWPHFVFANGALQLTA